MVTEITGRVQKIYDGTDYNTGEAGKNQPSVTLLDENTFEQHKFRINFDILPVITKKAGQVVTMRGLMVKSQEVIVKPAEYQGTIVEKK